MKKHSSFRQLVASVLIAALLLGNGAFLNVRAAESQTPPTAEPAAATGENLLELLQKETGEPELEHAVEYAPTDRVTVIVELEAEPLESAEVRLAQADPVSGDHDQIKAEIRRITGEADAVTLAGADAEAAGYDYYRVMNGFSMEIEYQYLDAVRNLDGVKRAFVGRTYEVPVTEPNMNASTGMIGATAANESGYDGRGMVVAVLDSGLDVSHEAFSNAPETPKYSREDLGALLETQKLSAKRVSLNRVYISEKIPYVYDYAGMDTDVYPYGGESHGTHVSGTVAADCDAIKGVAPEAQLMMLKVFADDGSTNDSVILAALDDAVKLGVDVINMSLGAPAGFSVDADEATREVYERVRAAGICLAISAGNNNSAAAYNATGADLPYAEDPDYGIVGEPSTYEAAMSVASAINARIENSPYLLSHGRQIFMTDVSSEADPKIWALDGTYNYVYCGLGTKEDFETAGYVKGKVALISRGQINFTEKVANAYEAGAIAVLVMNNQSGSIAMGVENYLIPAVSITQADGNFLRDREDCTVTFSPDYFGSQENTSAGLMSTFSSWGVTPDLKLKPEITAPGENIYSTSLNGAYELMSGTSMASPHIAGAFAAVKQYLVETYPEKTAAELYDLANALLMSTATPAMDSDGQYYSPRKQGAGMANISDAIQAEAYLSVSTSSRPKAELGYNEEGNYTFDVQLHNLSSEAKTYTVEISALIEQVSDGLFTGYSVDYAGNGISASCTQDCVTVPANGSAVVTVTIRVSPELREQILAAAPNGTYVDGFVRFVSEDDVDLTLPYLAFLGDWAKASVFDAEFNTDNYHLRPSIVYNAVSSNMTYLGQNIIYNLLHEDDFLVDPDRYVISPNSYMDFCSILSTQTGLLRSAKKLTYTVTPEGSDQVLREFSYDGVMKSYYHQSYGTLLWAEAFMGSIPFFDGYDQYGNQVPEGNYTYTVRAWIDGCEEEEYQDWSFDFAYDATPAQVDSYSLTEADGHSTLHMVVSDNFFLSGLQVSYDDDHFGASMAVLNPDLNADGTYTEDADGNRLYTVEFDVTDLLASLEEDGIQPTTLNVDLFDYALNVSRETLRIADAVPETVTLDRANVQLVPGMTTTLKAIVAPADAAGYTLSWSSSDSSVASVDQDGLVTAVQAGTAQITVKAGEASAVCAVTVVNETGIAIDPTEYTLAEGETLTFRAKLLDGYGTAVFTSSNETVASVTENGVLTAKAPGTVTITAASSVYPEVTATASITVVSANPDFVIKDGVLTSYTGKDKEIVIPGTVKEIGSYVLGWGSAVRKVIIPESVTKIGSSAFSYCSSLEEVVIEGSGLKEIGSYAFSSTYLTEIALPASVETIGDSAFSYCSYLQKATLAPGSRLQYLGNYAFTNTALLAFEFPETVAYIGDSCFANTYLTEAILPDSVAYLGGKAFFYCLYLERAVLPESLETLKQSTFWWCPSLTELQLSKNLKTLEQSAIYGTSLQTLSLPDTLETIGDYALGDNLFTRIELPANVKSLGNNALQGNTVATEIILNENLETMGSNVFQACYSLERVYIGKSLSSIGDNPFQACGQLSEIAVNSENHNFKAENGVLYSKDGKVLYAYAPGNLAASFTVPGTVEEIRPYAFSDNGDLEEVALPESLKTIGREAFARMELLRAIDIPDSVESLGEKAFTDCPALKTVQIGSGVAEIPMECFKNAYNLQTLSLSSGVRTIRNGAFSSADCMETLTIPEGVETIEYNAFMDCDSLRTVSLPASLNNLNESAFSFCGSMEAFQVASGSTSYASQDGVLFTAGYSTLMSYPTGKCDKAYTTPDGVQTVNSYAFSQTKYLETLTLSEGITALKDYAIYYCNSIRSLNLPDSLETVGFMGVYNTGVETLTFGRSLSYLDMFAVGANVRLRLVDLSRCENLSLGYCAFFANAALQTIIGGSGVTNTGWYPIDGAPTIYAPTGSALLTFAINNNLPYVVCDGLTVIPDLAQTSVALGDSLDVSIYTIGAVGDVKFTWTLAHKATGETVLTQEEEGGPFTVTPPCAGILILTVTAKDSAGTEAVSQPVTITVGDGVAPAYNWKTGTYLTTAHLYDLQQQELLPEDSTLGPVLLTVDSHGLTATLTIDDATAFGIWEAETCNEIPANEDGTFTLPLPTEQSAMTVTIAYGEKEVVGTLKLDLAGAIYQQTSQEPHTLTDGYYETEAVFYYNDWDQVSPATAFLKAAYLQVQDGACSVILEIQPWTQEDGTVVNLQGLSLITAGGVIAANRVEGENGSVYFRVTLPEAVDYTDVLLEYDDVSGTVDLPRIVKLWLDFSNAVPSEHITGATELQNSKKPTCTEDGYTGDTYCAICGELLSRGEVIPALGHDYVYVNQKMPTFTENGYSGDLVCSHCGEVKEYGHVIPATGSLIGIITVPSTPAKPTTPMDYTDVSTGDWFYDAVRYVYDEGLMNGTGSGKFSPYDTLTRAMVVTILYRMEGEPSTRYNGMFPDVANHQWYTDGVEWAAKNNIVTGYTTGKFGPEDPVTREQLAAILYRYARSKGYDVSASVDLSSCTDGMNVSSYAVSAVKWAVAKNILVADTGKLQPRDAANRAQVALAVANFHQQYVK